MPDGDATADHVDVLVLGAGWTYQFLEPELKKAKLSYAATSRDGRSGTIKFAFDERKADGDEAFKVLPDARTVVIVFPIYASGGSKLLVQSFKDTHPGTKAGFIQLGSTGIWDGARTIRDDKKRDAVWLDRHSPYDASNNRAAAEDELLALSNDQNPVTVLDLCGLWGGQRNVRHFIGRIAPTKEALAVRGSLSMVHGTDYSRLIVAIHSQWSKAAKQRFLVTDLRVYDIWELAGRYGADSDDGVGKAKTGHVLKWVSELMQEHGIRALPRTPEQLGKAFDSREVWDTFGLQPVRAGLD